MKKFLLFTLLFFVHQAFAGKYHPTIDYIFPLPDSELLTPKTTIILKLDTSFNGQISDLSTLISVQTASGAHTGRIFFAADDRTIIFKPDDEFKAGEFVDVTVKTSQFSDTDFVYTFRTAQRSGNVVDGLLKMSDLQNSDTIKKAAADPVRLINGVAVPSDFPVIEAHQYAETAPGKIFYATNYPQDGTGNYLIICTNDGTPYFYRRYEDVVRSGNLTVHPTGALTAHFYYKWFYVVLDHNFVEIDTIRVGHGYETDNHELQILENGHALLVARDRVKIDMSKMVSGGQKDATVEGHHFQELDADQNVIFEWRSWDHYDINDTYVNKTGGFIDYVHMNSIAVDYDGHYVISARDLNEITKINRNTGEIIWRLNGRNNEFTFVNDPAPFIYQHDFRPLPGKPNFYTIFDNGRGRTPQYSRLIEYKIDPQQKTIKKVWEYRHSPDWYASSMGSTQRLANGNTLGDFPGGSVRVAEVNPAGEVLFEFFSRGHSNYRCRRFEWSGKMLQPYLIVEEVGTAVRLIFNKFGDENVNLYNIYYGKTSDPTELLASTDQTYYDATELDPNQMYFFRVTAVDHNGAESGFSNQESGSIKFVGPGQNAVKNGTFESKDSWELNLSDGAQAVGRISDGQYKISVINDVGTLSNVQLVQDNIILLQAKNYVFEFDAYAGTARGISARIESASSPAINYGRIANTAISTRQKHYKFTFEMKHPTDTAARVVFRCGGEIGDIFLDNVSLTYTDPEQGDAVVKINFQPGDQSAPGGYQMDSGQSFGDRGNGFSYGWLDGANDETRFRDAHNDLRYATLNHLQKNGADRTWELALPNDTYYLYTVMGDAGYTDQINHLQIEDVVLRDSDGQDHFDEYTAVVRVTDGRLSIKPTAESSNAKLCFIDISNATADIQDQEAVEHTPASSALYQNYPNPFNTKTVFKFDLERDEFVTLTIFDVRGRAVKTLLKEKKGAGAHTVSFDATRLPSGVYLYRLKSPTFTYTKKMMLVK